MHFLFYTVFVVVLQGVGRILVQLFMGCRYLYKWARDAHARRPRFFWFCVALVVSVVCMLWIDRPVALYVEHELPDGIKAFFREITDWAKGAVWFQVCAIWLAIAAVGMMRTTVQTPFFEEWRYQALCAWFFLWSLIASGLVLLLAKFVIGRYRPRYLFRDETYGFLPFNSDFAALSYPSGHTQVIFCVATVCAVLWPRLTIPVYLFAGALGLSRVMVSAHYPSDIVMGAWVGICVTLWLRDLFHQTGTRLLWRAPWRYGQR